MRESDPALGTRKERLGLLEAHSAQRAGLLTERTRKQLEKARPTASQHHVEAKEPGEFVCLDCFHIGKLKGVGKVWQITACDAASSFALAQVFVGDPRAQVAAEFLRSRVVPFFRTAGSPLQRVLTNQGSEFKGAFDTACRDLDICHTRTKPRHAFTNGFAAYLALPAQGIRHDRKVQGSDRAHSSTILPWSHTLFGNLKTWLRGTFHGVSPKHLSRYLDEFGYRFDRRWREGELFGFVLKRTANAQPLPYHRLVAETAA